jgi:hypothetical protein
VPSSCGDGSIELMRLQGASPFGVTFCQVAPPSRVMWTSPSSEPAQSVLASWRDSARAKIVQ